jgi:Domain of unknown function (DUF4265)
MKTIEHDTGTSEGARSRVRFMLEDTSLGDAETLWARPLPGEKAELDNIPLLVFGVSLGDVVNVEEDDGWLVYRGVAERGGHSTYRVMLEEPGDPETQERFRELITRGCSYESLTPRFVAIDVPPATDIFTVYSLLERGMDDGLWTFEEGHCGHPVDGGAS